MTFADDSVTLSFLKEEVDHQRLTTLWLGAKSLLNVSKTKLVSIDFRKSRPNQRLTVIDRNNTDFVEEH